MRPCPAALFLFSSLSAFSESQPPSPRPAKAGQVEHNKPKKKKTVSDNNENIRQKLPASITFGGPTIPDRVIKKKRTEHTNPEIQNRTNRKKQKSSYNYKFLGDIALVVFNIFIAISTFLLWWSTKALWKSTNEAFIAANRPRLRVRYIHFDGLYSNGIGPTWVYIANVGGSTATVIAFKVVYAIRTGDTRRAPWIEELPNSLGHGNTTLFAGEQQPYEPRTNFIFESDDITKIMDGDRTFLIIGTIRYRDANQTERVTGFGWIYEPKTGEFSKPEKADQYNYED